MEDRQLFLHLLKDCIEGKTGYMYVREFKCLIHKLLEGRYEMVTLRYDKTNRKYSFNATDLDKDMTVTVKACELNNESIEIMKQIILAEAALDHMLLSKKECTPKQILTYLEKHYQSYIYEGADVVNLLIDASYRGECDVNITTMKKIIRLNKGIYDIYNLPLCLYSTGDGVNYLIGPKVQRNNVIALSALYIDLESGLVSEVINEQIEDIVGMSELSLLTEIMLNYDRTSRTLLHKGYEHVYTRYIRETREFSKLVKGAMDAYNVYIMNMAINLNTKIDLMPRVLYEGMNSEVVSVIGINIGVSKTATGMRLVYIPYVERNDGTDITFNIKVYSYTGIAMVPIHEEFLSNKERIEITQEILNTSDLTVFTDNQVEKVKGFINKFNPMILPTVAKAVDLYRRHCIDEYTSQVGSF